MHTCKIIPLCICLFLLGGAGSFAQAYQEPDSVTVAIAPEYNQVSKSRKFFLGESYRKLWATPVRMRAFLLHQEKEGMTILKQGGGQQTKSLRLRDTADNEWVLRTVAMKQKRCTDRNSENLPLRNIENKHPFIESVLVVC